MYWFFNIFDTMTYLTLPMSPFVPLKHKIAVKRVLFWHKLLICHAACYNSRCIIYITLLNQHNHLVEYYVQVGQIH